MRTSKLLASALVFIILSASCNFSRTYLNREEDKQEAVKVVDQFYDRVAEGKYEAVDALFSSEFWKVTSKEKLHNLLIKKKEKLGKLNTKLLAKWETKRIESSNPSSNYALLYDNKYDKFEAKESFRLVMEKNQIKIIAFNINSDAFLQ